MIITGIFMFLLGTKLGEAVTKTEVKYGGQNNITVNEERDENVILPGLGSPPFAPSFIHQGSNFFFNPQIMMPGGIPTGFEGVIPLRSENITLTTELKSDHIIETVELVVPEPPSIVIPQVEITETIQIPEVQVEIEMPQPNPVEVIVEEPLISCVEIDNVIPAVPMLIEEPAYSGGLYISEVDVRFNEIPPPPVLPPLIVTEIPRPVVVQENKRVILIPATPELTSFYPPSIIAEYPLIPTDCAQNIVMERFLPNIAFENSKMVELISIPATKRPPVVSSIIY